MLYQKYACQACQYKNSEVLISGTCSDNVSGISIQNSVRVNMASPSSPYEKIPVFCVTWTGNLMLAEEIPQVHAVGRSQPELQVSQMNSLKV